MIAFDLTYLGDLRCRAVHRPSGAVVITDAPVDNQGKGESFSPTDLVASGLGVCMLTLMGIVARQQGVDLAGTRVEVEKHMSPAPPRRIVRIVLRFALPAGIATNHRAAMEHAANTCPVALSIHPDITVEAAFHWA